jgi:hypothetical protein
LADYTDYAALKARDKRRKELAKKVAVAREELIATGFTDEQIMALEKYLTAQRVWRNR